MAPEASKSGPAVKPWTILIYMCGDNDSLEADLKNDFAEICQVGSSPEMYVAVQFDRRHGARRYLLPENPAQAGLGDDEDFEDISVNTGDPAAAKSFLRWALKAAPSEKVALIFSGMGVNPAYVEQVLFSVDSVEIEEFEQKLDDDDCLDDGEVERLVDRKRRDLIQRRLFSICHDQGSRAALEVKHLKDILAYAHRKRCKRKIDVVGFDVGATAFLEIAFQVHSFARYFCAPQCPLPDDGWPYRRILEHWPEQIRRGQDSPETLARFLVDAVCDKYQKEVVDVRMVALNLKKLATMTRALDSMAMAMLQSLGEWHVLNAFRRALHKVDRVRPDLPGELASSATASLKEIDDPSIPGVDLVEGLNELREALTEERDCIPAGPSQDRQQQHIELLIQLVEEALKSLCGHAGTSRGLFLHSRPHPTRGLTIFLPAQRTATEIQERTGVDFEISNASYLELDFSSEIHWPAFLGIYMLITEKPHALWSLISRLLATAGGAERDHLLGELVTQQSSVGGLSEQFKSLAGDLALTLSLEPREAVGPGRDERDETAELKHQAPDSVLEEDDHIYLLRLESSGPEPTVAEHRSRISHHTIENALAELESLLTSPRVEKDLNARLQALGETLGEDLIQDIAEELKVERQKLLESGSQTPHLRFQIPLSMMRYPWELLSDGEGLLCERFAMGRQVLVPARMSRRIKRRPADGLRVLIVADPQFTRDELRRFPSLPGAQAEGHAVAEKIQRLSVELAAVPPLHTTSLIGEKVTVLQMRQLLRNGNYDIVHFAGHAHYDEHRTRNSAWLLSDGMLRAFEIRNTLRWSDQPPWMVYANACEAAMDGRVGNRRDGYEGGVFGLATAFINHGVSAYLGPLWPIDDEIASQFARDFYEQLLLERTSLGTAVLKAKELSKKSLETKLESLPARTALGWASMVLYGEPTPHVLEALWTPGSTEE